VSTTREHNPTAARRANTSFGTPNNAGKSDLSQEGRQKLCGCSGERVGVASFCSQIMKQQFTTTMAPLKQPRNEYRFAWVPRHPVESPPARVRF
jgi:hypothetical protein